uniref:Putative LOV domain-containing protein n=1 Tax=Cylindrocystis brebissonii TaxID=102167 RepID=A0A126X483_9VIRI|nr:putative LOV domain-containing protein [Cylindrocystis brebissonii]|eukprot:TRINITY_DN4419_c0_g2_i1.p1 TRINITY_DN4419_c0_g2~~TRINITY_DN4419_c0_g2_i1.p1  ORF type:complete len:527 (+),score=111.43 TRINITY_DN4419_c0_g2_i1:339-1919(+)
MMESPEPDDIALPAPLRKWHSLDPAMKSSPRRSPGTLKKRVSFKESDFAQEGVIGEEDDQRRDDMGALRGAGGGEAVAPGPGGASSDARRAFLKSDSTDSSGRRLLPLDKFLSLPKIKLRMPSALSKGTAVAEREGVDEAFYPPELHPMRPPNGAVFSEEGAPFPSNEAFRQKVLNSLNVVDSPPEPRFDRLAKLAAKVFDIPIALVSLIDNCRQFFKASEGAENTKFCSNSRNTSFCAYTLLPAVDPCLVVENTLLDSRFAQNRLVTGDPRIRFYAGAPLLTSDGVILGALCLIDFKPRTFSRDDRELLLALAHLVVMEIEKHRRDDEVKQMKIEALTTNQTSTVLAVDAYTEGLLLVDVDTPGQPIIYVNPAWEEITGYKMDEVVGKHCGALLQGPLTSPQAISKLRAARIDGTGAAVHILNYRKDGTTFWNWMRIRPVHAPLPPTADADSPTFGGAMGAGEGAAPLEEEPAGEVAESGEGQTEAGASASGAAGVEGAEEGNGNMQRMGPRYFIGILAKGKAVI